MYKIKIYSSEKFDNKEFILFCDKLHIQDEIFYFFKNGLDVALFSIPSKDAMIYVLDKK